jgi:hypothetical protein
MRDRGSQVPDLTSLPVEEFEQLVAPFEAAFVRHMTHWTMDGLPRTGRSYSQYANCPLPTPEDRLVFILSYLKLGAIQAGHGALFGMQQPNANRWIHVLLPVLHQALADLGDRPSRFLVDLRTRLATVISPTSTATPLFITMAPNALSSVPKTRMNRKHAIAARKNAAPSKTSS